MGAWAQASGGAGKIHFLADWDAGFTKAIGLDIDLSAGGLGVRSQALLDAGRRWRGEEPRYRGKSRPGRFRLPKPCWRGCNPQRQERPTAWSKAVGLTLPMFKS